MAKLVLADLIAKADQVKSRTKATMDLYVKSLDGDITIQEPEKALCIDAMGMETGGDEYLTLSCVTDPNLKDADLVKAYGCTTPLELVSVLFKPGEIAQISKAAVELAGYGEGSVKLVEDLKN